MTTDRRPIAGNAASGTAISRKVSTGTAFAAIALAITLTVLAAGCSPQSGSGAADGSSADDSSESTSNTLGQLRPGQLAAPGYPLPDLTLSRHDDSVLSMLDLRGRPAVINLFGSWCAPCIREMPDIEEAHQELGDRATFLGIAVSDTVSGEKKLIENTGVTYDVVRDPDGDAMLKLGVLIMPSTIFVDSEGVIAYTHPGVLDEQRIAEILEEYGLLDG